MSKTTAPLLSFGASGAIGKTMVASTWKGIPYMRKYTIPANPNTDAQKAQRSAMTAVVSAYRNYFTAPAGRTALAVAAGVSGKPQSGFNFFASNAVKLYNTDPDGSMADGIAEAANVVTISCKNLDDGAAGDETGDFEVWIGSSANNLLFAEEKALASGDIVCTAVAGAAGVIKYFQLRKGGYARSGIYAVTLSGV